MKVFKLWSRGMDDEIQEIWCKAGFSIEQNLPADLAEATSFDLIWLAELTDVSARPSQETRAPLNLVYPKLFFVHSSAAGCMPAHWHAYVQQTIRVAETDWIVGSKLEEPLPPAVAEYLAQQKTADLAAVVYIVILESVFRETAEWCGHMSSVVGRM